MQRIYTRLWVGLTIFFIGGPAVFCTRIRKDNDPSSRTFTVRNLSTSTVEVYWMNLRTESRVLQFELVPGGSDRLNSHVVHEFEIREKADKDGICNGKKGKCRKKYFQISEDEDQVFFIESDFSVKVSNSRTRAQERAREALNECRDLDQYDTSVDFPLEKLERLTECMKQNVQESIYEKQDELDFQADVRRRMGSKLKTYACNDPNSTATEPLYEKEWNPNNPRLKLDNLSHTVKVLLQADTTLIALIENMATPSDCEYMRKLAKENAMDPTVVPWDSRKDRTTLTMLSRIYAYVNPAVKSVKMYAGLPEKGQDIFRFYHDSSSFAEDDHESVYSSSDVWPVQGNSYARLLIFCEVPDDGGGGAIHFPESGAHVHPTLGEGLLITYTRQPPGQGRNEKFTNEHTGCPIVSGNRTVLQHVFRLLPESSG